MLSVTERSVREQANRSRAGHAGSADPESHRARADARVGDRAAHPADVGRRCCRSGRARSTRRSTSWNRTAGSAPEWAVSENNRRAKYYTLTKAGRKALEQEAAQWERLAAAISLIVRRCETVSRCDCHDPPSSAAVAVLRAARRAGARRRTAVPRRTRHREHIAAGMPPEELAERRGDRPAGLEQRKEECRDMRGLNLLDNLRQDGRFALRQLRKRPASRRRDLHAGARPRRQRRDLRLRGRGADQAACRIRTVATRRRLRNVSRCSRNPIFRIRTISIGRS